MTKTIWILAIAAVFAVSMVTIPAFAGGHLIIEDVTVENKGKAQSVHIEVSAPIPSLPAGNFGFAVPTTKGFLVITSHPDIGLDSNAQPPAEIMHTHFLTAAFDGPCAPSPHVTFATKNEVGRLSVMGDEIWVENVPRGRAGDMSAGGTFSFMLDVRGDICIDIVNVFP